MRVQNVDSLFNFEYRKPSADIVDAANRKAAIIRASTPRGSWTPSLRARRSSRSRMPLSWISSHRREPAGGQSGAYSYSNKVHQGTHPL